MRKQKPQPPVIDERIEFRGCSYLRTLNADKLSEMASMIVFQEGQGAKRLAVLMPYDQFLALQRNSRLER